MAFGNGEHKCTEQICGTADERKESEIRREVETGMRIGEDVRGEGGEE